MKEILHFDSDYMQSAHPLILERIQTLAGQSISGYGADTICQSAKDKIRLACQTPQAEVEFLVGGTQANAVVLDAITPNYAGVLAADTGHITLHEAGAIQAMGRRVVGLPNHDGKLTAEEVNRYVTAFYGDESWEHMNIPGTVYISNPSEYGTVYTFGELQALRAACDKFHLKLFMDGARMGYGLAADGQFPQLPQIASLCDAFYIGGTKVGALFGEAVVVPNPNLIPHFFTQIKRHGALLAKGWLLGVQFDTLFTDNLYLNISSHAIRLSCKLKQGLKQKGYQFYIDSPSNLQFIVMDDAQVEQLRKIATFGIWDKPAPNQNIVRFATAWYTAEADVDRLLEQM